MIRSRRTAFPLLLLCSVLALAACGSTSGTGGDDGSGSASSSSSSSPATPAVPPSASPSFSATAPGQPASGQAAATSLTVDFSADGSATTDTWTLQCDGASPLPGSNVPDPAAACAVLAEQGAALFAEPERGMMCTQVIAGMQRAHVTGTVNGEAVDASFALTDGCQISRWENLTALLGPADGSL